MHLNIPSGHIGLDAENTGMDLGGLGVAEARV